MPLEFDGRAIPLERGKHYVVVYDVNRNDPHEIEYLRRWFRVERISATLLPVTDVTSVRIINVEQPETVTHHVQ